MKSLSHLLCEHKFGGRVIIIIIVQRFTRHMSVIRMTNRRRLILAGLKAGMSPLPGGR